MSRRQPALHTVDKNMSGVPSFGRLPRETRPCRSPFVRNTQARPFVSARGLTRLREDGVPAAKIRKAVAALREKVRGIDPDLVLCSSARRTRASRP